MRVLIPMLLACPSFASAAQPARWGLSQDAPQEAFQAARDDVQEALRKRDWKDAEALILAQLKAHEGADYVRPYLVGIEQDLRRAMFWQTADVPDSDDLITGDLLRYSPSSGQIRIRYRADNAGDFVKEGAVYVHPAFFADDWTVEFKGRSDELRQAALILNFDSEVLYVLQIGSSIKGESVYYKHTLSRLNLRGQGEQQILEQLDPKKERKASETITAKVAVSERKITFHYGGRKIMSVDNPTGSLGTMAWMSNQKRAFQPFGQFIVDGKVDTGWMTGLLDAAVARSRATFDESWERPAAFDAWPALESDGEEELGLEQVLARVKFVADYKSKTQKQTADKIRELSRNGRGQVRSLLAELQNKGEKVMSPKALGMLLLELGMKLDRPSLALESLARAEFADGSELDEALMTADLTAMAGKLEKAESLFAELAGSEPDLTYAKRRQAECALLLGQPQRAAAAIRAGLAAKPLSATLHELEWKTVKASKGPAWRVVRTKEGEHFRLFANTNKKLAHQAGAVLDEAWLRCGEFFGPLLGDHLPSPAALDGADQGPHSIAYLFAGEAGYLDYVRDIAEDDHEASLGVYTPLLKQIVAWNQPSYAALKDTLRHEVAHRYLDLALGERIPRWLNEGLAETFAASWTKDGKFEPGGKIEHWLLTIQANPKIPSPGQFFYMRNEEFNANSEANYAIAWATVHFLRFQSKVGKDLLPSILGGIAAGEDPAYAIDLSLDEIEQAGLQAELLKWLQSEIGQLRR